MTTYDDFSRPTTDTTMISPSDAGIHGVHPNFLDGPADSDSDIEEYLKLTEG